MVSPPHEAMHRIFQHDTGLYRRLSDVLGLSLPACSDVIVASSDLTESDPVERRVDTLLRLEQGGRPVSYLAVEAQGRRDPQKPSSWAYYIAYLWSKHNIPVDLLVVCQDAATARWARRPVSSGTSPEAPMLTVRPAVIGPDNMPEITDPDEARADLTMAALAAITHAANPDIDAILKALSTALQGVPEEQADPIIELTAQGLGKRPARQVWRNLMAVDLSFYTSWLSEEIREEGRAKGLEEGRAEGRAKGQAEGRGEDILLVLRTRGLDVPDEVRARITGCDDAELLSRWLTRAVTAPTAEAVVDGGE